MLLVYGARVAVQCVKRIALANSKRSLQFAAKQVRDLPLVNGKPPPSRSPCGARRRTTQPITLPSALRFKRVASKSSPHTSIFNYDGASSTPSERNPSTETHSSFLGPRDGPVPRGTVHVALCTLLQCVSPIDWRWASNVTGMARVSRLIEKERFSAIAARGLPLVQRCPLPPLRGTTIRSPSGTCSATGLRQWLQQIGTWNYRA